MENLTPLHVLCCTLQKAQLPELPPHAAYVPHENKCYDWGSYGWILLETGSVDVGQYRYFFFVNSSVRGPFLPAYARVSLKLVVVVVAAVLGLALCHVLAAADYDAPRHSRHANTE